MSPKYIAYGRVSSGKQAKRELSLPVQKKEIEDYAQRRGFDLVEFYEETKSGFNKNADRKKFKALLRRLQKDDEIKGVIFHKINRSSRNDADFAKIFALMDRKNIVIIQGEYNTDTAAGRFAFRVMAAEAIHYSENLREEAFCKMTPALEAGFYMGPPKLGYSYLEKRVNGRKILAPNDYAPLVRKAFELYDTGKYSMRTLAQELSDRGLRNLYWRKVNKSTMERILSDSFYHGVFTHGSMGTFVGNYKPLITKALFLRIQDRILNKSVQGKNRHFYPYNNKIEYEGVRLVGEKQKGRVYYRVNNPKKPRTGFYFLQDGKERKTIREDVLDNIFSEFFSGLSLDDSIVEKVRLKMDAEMIGNDDDIKKQRKTINTRLQLMDERIQRMKKKYWDGEVESDEWNEFKSEMKSEKDDLLQHLTNIERESSDTSVDCIEDYKSLSECLSDFSKLNSFKRATGLELFCKNIKIQSGTIEIELREEIRGILELTHEKKPRTYERPLPQTKKHHVDGEFSEWRD